MDTARIDGGKSVWSVSSRNRRHRSRSESFIAVADPLASMTSVKEFRVAAEPTATDLGRGRFVFTDDYSVFDWGQMPDPIPGKGASLCTMGAFNFELLEDADVPTHYRGVAADGGEPVPLAEARQPPREMAIELTQVPDLPFTGDGYDYDAYYEAAGENYLVPLEIVFRNRVPVGSSLRKRADPREVGLDRDSWPEEPVDLPEPVVEFSTKYEEQDRYLDPAEAARIAGAADLADLEALAREVNEVVTEQAASTGFTHEDGKIEVLYHRGTLKVGDVVGTFDENRFSYDGQQVSKEVVRQWYKREQPAWVEAVGDAKATAEERGVADWRPLCEVQPRTLPEPVLTAVAEMYQAGANAYTADTWFDAPGIEQAVDAVREL
jgi:phosphoribosylaminoimidazole-succinocarboxamide synthase